MMDLGLRLCQVECVLKSLYVALNVKQCLSHKNQEGNSILAMFLLSLTASVPLVLFSSTKKELKMGIENIQGKNCAQRVIFKFLLRTVRGRCDRGAKRVQDNSTQSGKSQWWDTPNFWIMQLHLRSKTRSGYIFWVTPAAIVINSPDHGW